ncbi:NfeD family protein [Roseomonas sp. GC11]|uniref:NfeD family protein n=1 Tax=Roseomonas sp. GC11 TaxID=2950546 RepID=UPI00210C4F0D|nr:NfeD family protein [Roseomonas sp. GC11]MCQ4162322.1 NfeD family protein [Roseomonas sp. GC11]
MPLWSLWMVLGLLGLGAELVVPGVFLVWAGAAALGTGLLVAAVEPSLPAALVVFVGLLAAGIAVSLKAMRPAVTRRGLNTPASGLVGRHGVWLGAGRARVGDSDWPARLEGRADPGQDVRVLAVEGMTLLVRPD